MVSIKKKVPLKKLKTNIKSVEINKSKLNKKKQKLKVLPQVAEEVKQTKKEVTNEVAAVKRTKYVMPSQAITDNLVNSCLNSLLNVITAQDKQKKAIFDDEKPIFAEIHCIKIQNTRGNLQFQLPHSTISSTGEVCLITPDVKKGRKHDHEPTIDRWEEILRKAGVTEIKTILPMRQLRVEYDQYELKRRLLTQHDFIMVDTRVLNHVSHLLGKMFFKKHNMLIPVRINEDNDIKKSINVGLHTVVMRLGEGETGTVNIGHTAMLQEKIKDNILALVQQLKTKYPGGEINIRAINIKLPLSVSLPLYLTLRSSNTVKPPKLTQKRPKHYSVLEDELSTMPGRQVKVAPDGTVKLKKQKKNPTTRKITEAKLEMEEENDEDVTSDQVDENSDESD